jgi:hypothetical protein
MSRPPLLTQERTPASSPSPIVPNSQYEPSPTQKLRYFRRPTLAAAFNIDVSDLDFKEEEPVTAKSDYRIVRFDMKWTALGSKLGTDFGDIERQINALGAEGWELVKVSEILGSAIATIALVASFKRTVA